MLHSRLGAWKYVTYSQALAFKINPRSQEADIWISPCLELVLGQFSLWENFPFHSSKICCHTKFHPLFCSFGWKWQRQLFFYVTGLHRWRPWPDFSKISVGHFVKHRRLFPWAFHFIPKAYVVYKGYNYFPIVSMDEGVLAYRRLMFEESSGLKNIGYRRSWSNLNSPAYIDQGFWTPCNCDLHRHIIVYGTFLGKGIRSSREDSWPPNGRQECSAWKPGESWHLRIRQRKGNLWMIQKKQFLWPQGICYFQVHRSWGTQGHFCPSQLHNSLCLTDLRFLISGFSLSWAPLFPLSASKQPFKRQNWSWF